MDIKIIHRYDVSPPANSVPATALPLTFFDIPWLLCRPVQRLFFYDFPQSPPSFAHTTLSLLVRSLSLCLRRFFPFAANLVLPLAPPQEPYILYSDGDSLCLTVAESAASFAELVSDEARDATLIHPLVPQLPPPRASDSARVGPLMAVQVTLFPNEGICIGVQFLHVAADGRSFNHFMKSWASIHRSRGDPTCTDLDESSPFHDREVIKDPNGLKTTLLKDWWNCVGSSPTRSPSKARLAVADKVRVTLVLGKDRINRLKAQVLSQLKNDDIGSESEPIHLSTFVVACAFIWVCIIKSKDEEHERRDQTSSESGNNELCYFCFLADCRDRLEYSIPSTYFGNYLDICILSEKRNTLLGKSGVSHAARAIGARVKEVKTGGGLRGAAEWITGYAVADNGDLVTVAGSPRLKVYDTDFGWGRPTKSHVAHVDTSGVITLALAECRNGDGGVEVGLALPKVCMEKLVPLLEKGLK
ncbi:coumaroyl-CoA:anthocyanidin 3-O-glucoside-6''-O-coumaroyltransferase 1-like [Rhodamnia argentea]|uniref:Coumaroyl-CoA:anthocyanidin 3-O-glucoside-6''-O-coumaroyltransferase 1-like n=1 Tax=Rhodamnia argentea TaxID=178133 RepID=A0A8B8MXG9_9MYRT|nr:coumaroyl-CoA:anthocyanidin 3-O-glucoside-6''-O-coumaroyltransferase 1-like [Rhodamnia argentea]